MRLQGNAYTVIGVLPPSFVFSRNDANGAVAARSTPTSCRTSRSPAVPPQAGDYSALVRARAGASPEAVRAAVAAAGKTIDARAFNGRGLSLYAVGLQDDLVAKARPALILLGAAGALLALMLRVNLASVLLARAAQREHEFAVSRALGASGAAVVRATLLEGGLLGVAGGALGALLAVWATRRSSPWRRSISRGATRSRSTGGSAPAMIVARRRPRSPRRRRARDLVARASLSSLLANSAVRGGGGHGRLRRVLVVAQVAITLVLLGSGGLVARSFERLLQADPGFDPEGVLTFRVRSPPEFFPSPPTWSASRIASSASSRAIPGVTGASATSALPLTASAVRSGCGSPGRRQRPAPMRPIATPRSST